jgi:hypothetical protein
MPPLAIAIAIIIMIVTTLVTAMMMKPQKQKAASLDDFNLPTYEDGTPQLVLFGDGWVSGPMMVFYGNLRTKKIKASGGK